jgi:xeroderma pigmentosum group C-complementing protein
MPPKRRGRPKKSDDKADSGEEAFGDASPINASGRQSTKGKGKAVDSRTETGRTRRTKANENPKSASAVPDVFQDILAEALSSPNVEVVDRPRKRRRARQPGDDPANSSALPYATHDESHGDDDAALEFEDVIPSKQEQTAYNDSEEGSSEDDLAWEEVEDTNFLLKPSGADEDGDLDLTLTAEKSPQKSSPATRRKTLNKADRALCLNVHKMHLLCLLSHIDRRNNWCNDREVQSTLKSLLTKQMMECFKPKESYTQFGKAESVKKGLSLITKVWESKYSITAKGMQRPFWAENDEEIRHVSNERLLLLFALLKDHSLSSRLSPTLYMRNLNSEWLLKSYKALGTLEPNYFAPSCGARAWKCG